MTTNEKYLYIAEIGNYEKTFYFIGPDKEYSNEEYLKYYVEFVLFLNSIYNDIRDNVYYPKNNINTLIDMDISDMEKVKIKHKFPIKSSKEMYIIAYAFVDCISEEALNYKDIRFDKNLLKSTKLDNLIEDIEQFLNCNFTIKIDNDYLKSINYDFKEVYELTKECLFEHKFDPVFRYIYSLLSFILLYNSYTADITIERIDPYIEDFLRSIAKIFTIYKWLLYKKHDTVMDLKVKSMVSYISNSPSSNNY